MLLKQLVHILVVCSVFWPNCFCLVLFYLFIGSTLKRLCLGKERSSSNYLIYFLTLCLSNCPHDFSPYICMSTLRFCCVFFTLKMWQVFVGTLQIVAFIYICWCFAWQCAYVFWLLNSIIACTSNTSFVCNYSSKSCCNPLAAMLAKCVTDVAVYTFIYS